MFQSSRNLKEATIFFFPPSNHFTNGNELRTNFNVLNSIKFVSVQLLDTRLHWDLFYIYIYTHVYVSYLFLVYLASTRINLLLLLLTNERSFVCVIYPRCREKLHLRARRISGINESMIREQLSSRCLSCV